MSQSALLVGGALASDHGFASEYLMLTDDRPSFVDATRRVRERLDVESLGIGEEEFEGLRDESPGREVAL